MIDIKSYYGKTHQGPYLNLNEDDIQINLEYKIFTVLDGFGGSSVGDKAIDLVKDKLESFFSKVSNDPDATMPYFYSPRYLIETNALVNSLFLAHNSLLDDNKTHEMNERGGVSILSGMISESILSLVSVGNCAGFLYRNNQISVISTPDCIAPVGRIEQNLLHKTFPLVALGLHEELTPKIWEINLLPGDKIVFLTDGVFSRLGLEDLKYAIDQEPNDNYLAVKNLFKAANDRGNLDNQSAIIVSV